MDLITDSDINKVKFGLINVRKQLISDEGKSAPEMVNNHIPEHLLNILDTYLSDDSISVNKINIV